MGDDFAGDVRLSHLAIIGLACRFPGAATAGRFWENLRAARESITFFSENESTAAGVDPALLANPAYVNASGVLSDIEDFDASFFGFAPREADVLDVQQRIFLECAWEALEDAGVNPDDSDQVCGVFAGSGPNTYLLSNLLPNPDIVSTLGAYQLMLANDKDYLSTRVAYKLNLRGPAITVQTACSTSLVAVHLACQSLLSGECDIAIAGGVSVQVPHRHGYLYQEGMILSPDGHCRAFDRRAQGTVGGSGVGAVVLRRLDAAIPKGDRVRAVIRGSAVNNDGALKAGYTAPAVAGQAAAVAEALAVAGLNPSEISYVEAHGTGTPVGDPIEVAALRRVFGAGSEPGPKCALGSVKTNIGHVDTAAGVAGLIKTVLALEHREIPASLHFEQPNPALELADTPFYVNTRHAPWPNAGGPRRAGVSSFGIGGTNAHVVVEEAPPLGSSASTRPWQLVVLSAKTATSLETMAANLASDLRTHPQLPLADVAFTLGTGRKTFSCRTAMLCRDIGEAVDALADPTSRRRWSAVNQGLDRPVAFTFCGQGLQYASLGAGLYASEPFFREQVDSCAAALEPALGVDVRRVVFGGSTERDSTADLNQTALSQPVLFTMQYATAKLWMHWGVAPHFMLGHSLGEYVAACVSGVFSLEDALALVAARGRLMQQLPPGMMLAVQMPEERIRPLLPPHVALAAINAPEWCVVSGPVEEIVSLRDRLRQSGTECQPLRTSHAFHSSTMDPIIRPFAAAVSRVTLHPPQIPFVSNLTGTWIRSDEAQNPEYWAQHLRHTVQYVEGVKCLLASEAAVLVEVGPSQGLEALCRRLEPDRERTVVRSVRHPSTQSTDLEVLLEAVARLWLAGGRVDWWNFWDAERRRKVSLPTYPFERQRCWIERPSPSSSASGDRPVVTASGVAARQRSELADWFYVPSWRRSAPPRMDSERASGQWLVFTDSCGIGAGILERLGVDGQQIVEVGIGAEFSRVGERQFVINPRRRSDYDTVIGHLMHHGSAPATMLHLWNVSSGTSAEISAGLEAAQDRGFFSLLSIGQALATHAAAAPIRLFVFTNNLHQVAGEEYLCPEKATLLGPVTVLPREFSNITVRALDVSLPPAGHWLEARLIDQLASEILSSSRDPIVAFRDAHRWVPAIEPVRLEPASGPVPPGNTPLAVDPGVITFRKRGVYLITGGLGGIGLTLAEHLARTTQARLVLTSRRSFPARDHWDHWMGRDDGAEVSEVVRTLRRIEELGSEVLIAAADVADLSGMREVCRTASERSGRIDGVIHAAGIAGGGVIALKTREAAEHVLAPKVTGAIVLGELAREFQFEFLVFCSSLTSVLPEVGQVDYVAANAFLDAYVPVLRNQGFRAVGINWDAWQRVGMAARTAVPPDLAAARERELQYAIAPDEGPELLDRIAASGLSRVVVSTRRMDLRRRDRTAEPHPEPISERAERSPSHARPALATHYIAPATAVQQRIAEDWQHLLGIQPIGVFDSFFELGGHSLLAIQLISRLATAFKVQTTLTSFFENPTIAGVAALVEAAIEEASAQGPAEPPAPASGEVSTAVLQPPHWSRESGEDPKIPLSMSQHQLWLADQIEPGSPRYNEFGIHAIDGPLNVDALQRSFDDIVRRHQVLRTTFPRLHDGLPEQRISPAAVVPIRHLDLSSLADGERLREAHRIAGEEARTPFDLGSGPLVRIVLIRLAADSHWLTLALHHIIFDGWSAAVFIRELLQLYEAFSRGAASPIPELPIQYADFSRWQHEWMDETRRSAQLAYWRTQLAGGTAVLPLPYDRRPSGNPPLEGRRINFALDAEVSSRLKAVGQRAGATLFTTMLAAYAVLLQRYTGQDDLVVGAPVANRKWKVTEHMIGYFVNTLPIRVDLRGSPTFIELLTRLQRTVLEGHEHGDIALGELLPPPPNASVRAASPFQVLFVYRNATMERVLAPPGVRVRELEYEAVPVRSDLDLYIVETETGLAGYFVYPIDLFDRVSIDRAIRRLETLIGQLLDRPEVSIADLPREKPPSLSGWRTRRPGATHLYQPTDPATAPLPVVSKESE